MRSAAGLLLLAPLLLGAPEDPAQLLRVAWASQYEWREDGVGNATLGFHYTYSFGAEGAIRGAGDGSVVVVGNEIARRHYPDLRTDTARELLDQHVAWVVARFVREPFEEVFADARVTGPEETAFGAKLEAGDRAFYVKDSKIVATEVDVGPEGKPHVTLVEYTTGAVGGGYAILGERHDYTRPTDAVKVESVRTLATGQGEKGIPIPKLYTFRQRASKDRIELAIDFTGVRFDAEHPVVLDPKARDLLKAAWECRYVLPDDIRIQGDFQRRVDRELGKAGWTELVKGEFQLWGMDSLQVLADRKASRRVSDRTVETCRDHLRWIFDLQRRRPFEEEFAECGFLLEPAGAASIVKVVGYPRARAFRVEGGIIVGHEDEVGGTVGWWEHELDRTREGTYLLEGMRRELSSGRVDLAYRYTRTKGLYVIKEADVVGLTGDGFVGGTAVGVCSYTLRRLKLSLP